MNHRILGALLACLVGLFASGQVLALDLDVADFKLDNGLEVVVIPDHRAAVVTHMIWYKVGAADEPKGKAGIAHFLEHLMFKGTTRYPQGEFSRLVRINGGQENAFTSQDYTGYFQRIAKDRLDMVMELEADRMQNLVLTDENVLPELQVVQEERRQRTDNNPPSLLSEQMDAVLYAAHPYGKPIIGWMSEVEKLDHDDALTFYRAHYQPANAVVVVAGDVTADEVKGLAEKYYGALKNEVQPEPRIRTAEPKPIAARRVILKDARAATPIWQRDYLSPSAGKAGVRQGLAIDVLADILGGGTTSRLYQKLVIEQKLAGYVGAWYSGDALDYGTLGIYAAPNPGVAPERIEEAVDQVVAQVLQDGVTAAELDRTRNHAIAEAVYLLDQQETLARIFGTALVTGQTAADLLHWDTNMEKVTTGDVHEAAKAVLDIEASVTGILLPDGLTQAAGNISEPAIPGAIEN